MIWDKTGLFTRLKSLILGSLYILCPGGELKAKEYKIGSRVPLTIDPLIQSHFKWTLSIPVILIGLSLLYFPGISWTKPGISPRGPEFECVKPYIV